VLEIIARPVRFRSMQPRFTIQASCAASFTTTSTAVRPEEAQLDGIDPDRPCAGARFGRRTRPRAVDEALHRHRAAAHPAHRASATQVVADQVALGVPGARKYTLSGFEIATSRPATCSSSLRAGTRRPC